MRRARWNFPRSADSIAFLMPTAGRKRRINQAPAATNPAFARENKFAIAVINRTVMAARRQLLSAPPRHVRASNTAGETHAMKSRMWLRSSTGGVFGGGLLLGWTSNAEVLGWRGGNA